MPREMFSDVMLDHPWVERYRIPMVSSHHPDYHYFVTLADFCPDNEARTNLWDVLTPTEEEAAIVGSYIEFKVADQGFREHYLKEIRSRILDVDSGYNTISLAKRGHGLGWGFVRMSYRDSILYPYYDAETKYFNLVDLLDFIETYSGDKPREAWVDWKTAHNITRESLESATEVEK